MNARTQSLELSRKEQDRLPRNAKIEESLDAAIQITAVQFSAHAGYDKQLGTGLSLCGKLLIALMSEDDEPILPMPVWLSRSGPSNLQLGLVLTLRDRAIAAWTEGSFKLRYFARTIPYSTVTTAEQQEVVGAYDGSVSVDAEDVWTFNVPSMFEDVSIIQVLVNNFLGQDIPDEVS